MINAFTCGFCSATAIVAMLNGDWAWVGFLLLAAIVNGVQAGQANV